MPAANTSFPSTTIETVDTTVSICPTAYQNASVPTVAAPTLTAAVVAPVATFTGAASRNVAGVAGVVGFLGLLGSFL
jgi:hypothetical protein